MLEDVARWVRLYHVLFWAWQARWVATGRGAGWGAGACCAFGCAPARSRPFARP